MFHFFSGKIKRIKSENFLVNDSFWIQVMYGGTQEEGAYFLYPYLDDNKKTIVYYAFDTFAQKEHFELLLKISGIGPRIAFNVAQIPLPELQEAVEQLDMKIFQPIPGVGPKLAKKIILELKGNIDLSQVAGIDQNQKAFKAVVKALSALGYDSARIKEVLVTYPDLLDEHHLPEIIKWVISKL